jgi:hypothetical protein
MNESLPELPSIFVDVVGEVEHDSEPHLVRGDLEIAMIYVGFVKGL